MADYFQCADCGVHLQTTPRGDVQGAACPECGGKRLFRMQPNPVQSEGTLRNMVDMETGKDAGGNPDGEGILAPPSGRAILTAFAGTLCPHCNADLMGSDVCPHCGLASGIPSELRPEIAGAPLTEGGIMQTEHTDPLDTGAHGRDEYTHGHVLAATAIGPIDMIQGQCPRCGGDLLEFVDGHTRCDHCGDEAPPLHQNIDPIQHIPHAEMHAFDPPKKPNFLQRTFAITKTSDYEGWPNWDTWHTKLLLDNDEELYHMQQQMAREGWNSEQIRDWTIENVVGPHNREQIQQAKAWNEIPEPERLDPHYEEFAKGNPKGAELADAMGFGRDVRDIEPAQMMLMDPEMIDWHGIHHQINSDYAEEQRYEKGEPPSWKDPKPDPNLDRPGTDVFPSEWNSHVLAAAVESGQWEPDERLMDEFKHKDLTPFIAADPRLKLVEKKTSPGPTMANYSRTNNMEPYEVLWAQEPEIQLGAREAGLWGDLGAAALTGGGLALAVPTGGADLPEVAAGDAALLGGGEAASDAAASSGAGGLMSKAMSGAGGLAKAEGITSLVGQGAGMGEKALGLGGGGASQAGGGGEGYQSPLQQFTHVLAAFVESDSHVFPRIDNEGNYPCPKCHEFMLNKHDGQCDHCGYTIPYDGPSIDNVTPAIWDQPEQIPIWNPELISPHNLGPVHQGKIADYETPASNPDVGVKHDDPEDIDQKEFNDQDKNPENLLNPNIQDSGASGEDQVRNDAGKPSQGQFAPDSPAIQRMEMLMPLIEKYYHSDESGANDPMIKQLHEELEAENPGYLNQANPEIAERYMQGKKQPEHVHAAVFPTQGDEPNPRILAENSIPCPRCHGKGCPDCAFAGFIPERRITPRPNEPPRAASVKEAIMPPMQQGNLNAQQQALDPTGLNPSMQPSSATPQGGAMQQGHCPNCGSVIQADGSCPNCGAHHQQAEGAGQLPGGPSVAPHSQIFTHTDLLASLVDSANHQGPVTPEQIAAVQQYLIQQGRVDEIPNVPLDPGNPEYVKILAEIQQKPEMVPPVTPEEQTQPPPPQPQAPGGMPVPGMAPGEAGGQPMQPMSSFLPELDFTEHTGADNIAPRCPECGSGTTGLVGDVDNHAKCHSCKHIWQLPGLLDDNQAAGNTSISKVALRDDRQHGGGQNEQANPVGVPAAAQTQQTNQGNDEDSSMTWKDTEGAPLKAGQTYQMLNPSYSLPDLVRVERVKPDGIDVTLLGTFANDLTQHDPNTLTSSTPISKEDADLQQLSFEPVNQTADDRNNEPPPGSAAPGYAQVPPSGQTTDEQMAQEPQMMHARVEHDPDCPRCGSFEFTSAMITPEATEHSCFRCGHDWVTEEKDERLGVAQREGWTNPSADWLNEDEDAEDFSQRSHDMQRAGQESRSLAEIAEKDDRLRATREYLSREGTARQERLAGKHFTPREQRELIDEDGEARNSDLLDLAGTHYTARDDWTGKANGDNVRDADLFLGI